jgi:hypothetical protein
MKVAVVLIVLVSACTDDTVVEVGVIEFLTDPLRVEVVPPLMHGQPFAVNVRTYGGGCVSLESTEVELEGDLATITPYNHRRLGTCTADLRHIGHVAEIKFETPGMKAIRVIGRKHTGPQPDQLVGHEYLVRVD